MTAAALIRKAAESDQPAVTALLEGAGLPVVSVTDATVWVCDQGDVIGCVGLESYGDTGLLRSLVVRDTHCSAGIGGRLVDRVMAEAAARGHRRVVLLTLNAHAFFERRSFSVTDRSHVTGPIVDSWEFRHHGCDDAYVLVRGIGTD